MNSRAQVSTKASDFCDTREAKRHMGIHFLWSMICLSFRLSHFVFAGTTCAPRTTGSLGNHCAIMPRFTVHFLERIGHLL